VKADELRGARVKFWFAATGELEKEMLAQIAEFNRSNLWGITVEGRSFLTSNTLEDQITPLLSKPDDLPQAVAAPLEMLLSWQARAEVVVPLDGYIQDPEWSLATQDINDFWPAFWQAEQVDGKRWAVPAGRNPQVLFYNRTWAGALGFSQPPATPAEFRTQACAALKANLADEDPENDGMGGWIISNDPLALESWRRAFGGEALPDVSGRAYTFNTPATLKTFTFLRKLIDENCAWTARNPVPYAYFAQRRTLFYSGSLSDLPFQERAMAFEKSGDLWTILPYPAENQKPVVLFSGGSYGVLRSTPARQLASWLFLRHLMLARVQARLASAAGLLPERASALEAMSDFRNRHPQWAQASTWKDILQPAPRLASWRTVRRILQDAAWQIFSPIGKVDTISAVLSELDATIQDVLKIALQQK
jgi:ABC-type glycerol-3-phosphate transport system substrate-binding protein